MSDVSQVFRNLQIYWNTSITEMASFEWFFFWFQNIVHMMGSFQKLPFFSHSTDSSRKSRISSIVSVGAPTDDARGPGGYETRPERDTYEPRP